MNLSQELKQLVKPLTPQDEEALIIIREHLKQLAKEGFGVTYISLSPFRFGYNVASILSVLREEGLEVIEEMSAFELEYKIIWLREGRWGQISTPKLISLNTDN